MKKTVKKLFSAILVFALALAMSAPVFAASNNQAPYKKVLDAANRQYNLDLGYVPVDVTKVSVEDYKQFTFEFAEKQRILLNHISNAKVTSGTLLQSNVLDSASTSTTKTVEKWCDGYDCAVSIEVTYRVTGNKVSKPTSCHIYTTGSIGLSNLSSPKYSIIDSGRTLSVKYTGTYIDGAYRYNNATFYAEFTYDD